ncbi:MAG TPA: hypothetical protein VGB17_12410 [Pyrinomonadaceae bacterium]|jgi:uncharacterized membrane protein
MQNPPPEQQGYGNQYGMPPNAPAATADVKGKTGIGLDANLAAALGYPIGLLAIIMFIMEKENKFARFHALQSLLYHVAAIVFFIALMFIGLILALILSSISGSLATLVGIIIWLLYMVVFFAYFGGLLYAAYKAYQGHWFKLPLVGNFAEKTVNK